MGVGIWYFYIDDIFYYKGYSVSHIFLHTYEKDCFWLKQTKYDYLRLQTSSSAYSLCNLSFKIRKVKSAFLTLHSLLHNSTYRFWITPSGMKASLSLSYNTISFLYPSETPKSNIQSSTCKSSPFTNSVLTAVTDLHVSGPPYYPPLSPTSLTNTPPEFPTCATISSYNSGAATRARGNLRDVTLVLPQRTNMTRMLWYPLATIVTIVEDDAVF